jgi:hypothetical protein
LMSMSHPPAKAVHTKSPSRANTRSLILRACSEQIASCDAGDEAIQRPFICGRDRRNQAAKLARDGTKPHRRTRWANRRLKFCEKNQTNGDLDTSKQTGLFWRGTIELRTELPVVNTKASQSPSTSLYFCVQISLWQYEGVP